MIRIPDGQYILRLGGGLFGRETLLVRTFVPELNVSKLFVFRKVFVPYTYIT